MKKKYFLGSFLEPEFLIRQVMRLFVFMFCNIALSFNTISISAQTDVFIDKDCEITVDRVFDIIENQTDFKFIYKAEMFKNLPKINLKRGVITVSNILEKSFKNSKYNFVITDDKDIIIKDLKQQLQEKTIEGTIKSKLSNTPVSYANVSFISNRNKILGGTAADENGVFRTAISTKTKYIQISALGYKTIRIPYDDNKQVYTIFLEDGVNELSEVVISGRGFARKIETFTGSSTTINSDQIEAINPVNLVNVLEVLEPEFRVIENNLAGGNPNALPLIRIRGESSFSTLEDISRINNPIETNTVNLNVTGDQALNRDLIPTLEEQLAVDPNQPLIIINGFESTLREFFDTPPQRVKSITILKDASSTSIYGPRGANGVIVIELKESASGNMRFDYSVRNIAVLPDFSDYNLLNAREKLELEVQRGLDPFSAEYNSKQRAISSGVDTDWKSKAVTDQFYTNHNLTITGGANNIRYAANFNSSPNKGVLLGNNRDNLRGTLNLMIRRGNFSIRNRMTYSDVSSQDSPLESFRGIVELNPYYRLTDGNGNILKNLALEDDSNNDNFLGRVNNPFYNASLETIFENNVNNFTNNLVVNWKPSNKLRFSTTLSYVKENGERVGFKPADHTDFVNLTDVTLRGKRQESSTQREAFGVLLNGTYLFNFNRHNFTLNAVGAFDKSETIAGSNTFVGFSSSTFSTTNFGRYNERFSPNSFSTTQKGASGSLVLNYDFDRIVFADASLSSSISSNFGSNEGYATFWSSGLGVNLHNSGLFKNSKVVNFFKIIGSIGNAGSTQFAPQQSLILYRILAGEDVIPYNNLDPSVALQSYGNQNLAWQQVLQKNVSVDISLFNNKLNLGGNYYHNETKDAIQSKNLPAYTGLSATSVNIGGIVQQGWTGRISVNPIQNQKMSLTMFANGSRGLSTMYGLTDTFTESNEAALNDNMAYNPKRIVLEGQPTTVLYTAQSLGIDPQTGQEIFQDENGNQTFSYAEAERVAFDTNPDLTGAFGFTFRYKQVSLSSNFRYQIGGKAFNSTLLRRIENIGDGRRNNVDSRALRGRWQNPGDVTFFKDISDVSDTFASTRFVQDADFLDLNSVNLQYNVNPSFVVERLGLNNLSFSLAATDIFRVSKINQERGLDTPFTRTFVLTINTSF